MPRIDTIISLPSTDDSSGSARWSSFIELLRVHVTNGQGSGIDDQTVALLESAAARGLFSDIINLYLRSLLDDDFDLPFLSTDTMPLYIGDSFSLMLKVFTASPSPPMTVLSTVEDRILIPLSGDFRIMQWMQVSPLPNGVFDSRKRLTNAQSFTVHKNRGCIIRAGADVYAPDTPGVHLLLICRSRELHRFHWVYDRTTLLPLSLMTGDITSDRITFALSLLSLEGQQASLDVCRSLVREHPDHHIRWEAVRQALLIDMSQGIDLTRFALNDQHPEVREAASETLTEISRFA